MGKAKRPLSAKLPRVAPYRVPPGLCLGLQETSNLQPRSQREKPWERGRETSLRAGSLSVLFARVTFGGGAAICEKQGIANIRIYYSTNGHYAHIW